MLNNPYAKLAVSGAFLAAYADREAPSPVSPREGVARQYRAFGRMVDRGTAAHQVLRVALTLSMAAAQFPRVRAWTWIYMGRVYARQRDEYGAILCAQRAWRIAERNHLHSLRRALMRRGRGMCDVTGPDNRLGGGAQ